MPVSDELSSATLTQTIDVGGVSTVISGSAADAYVRDAQGHAHGLGNLIEYARSLLKENDIVIDVGANIGLSAIALARLVPGGHVFAFEPSEKNVLSLRANIQQNGIGNVSIIEAAVGDSAGMVHLTDALGYGAASHIERNLALAEPNVETIDIDSFVRERNICNVALIKIDVEGYEPWVLSGARSLIERDKPKIWLEFNSWCLIAFGQVQPLSFATALFQAFSAKVVKGAELTPVADTISFLHDNMVSNSCVTDLLLELRDHHRIPASLGVIDIPHGDVRLEEQAAQLRRKCANLEVTVDELKRSVFDLTSIIETLRKSNSWRITRPLRILLGGTD